MHIYLTLKKTPAPRAQAVATDATTLGFHEARSLRVELATVQTAMADQDVAAAARIKRLEADADGVPARPLKHS